MFVIPSLSAVVFCLYIKVLSYYRYINAHNVGKCKLGIFLSAIAHLITGVSDVILSGLDLSSLSLVRTYFPTENSKSCAFPNMWLQVGDIFYISLMRIYFSQWENGTMSLSVAIMATCPGKVPLPILKK